MIFGGDFFPILADNFQSPVLLNLHRPYFAQALQESPADLHHHRYLPSVVATYRSAWRLSRGLAMTWRAVPAILARLLLPWSHALSAAVSCHLSMKKCIHEQEYDFLKTIMCILVTRAPTSHLTTPALEELDNLTSLFDSASSCRPSSDLLVRIVPRLFSATSNTSYRAPSKPFADKLTRLLDLIPVIIIIITTTTPSHLLNSTA